MVITTNAENRKNLVKAIADHFGERAVYLGPPSFAYKIGSVTVDRDANIILEDDTEEDGIRRVLAETGIDAEREEEEMIGTAISLPLGTTKAQTVVNLINMVHAKQYLINQSAGRTCLEVSDELVSALAENTFEDTDAVTEFIQTHGGLRGMEFADGNIIFTEFPAEDAMVYCRLVSAMMKTAGDKKRVSFKQTVEENEKYYMRAWLVSIGFGGNEGKEVRNFLLKNLKGHTAFRTTEDAERWKANRMAERGNNTCSE